GLFRDHIYNVICNGDASLFDYVLSWMANAVHNPNERPGTALVLRGKQGTGKSIFCREFGALFGQHFRQISNARHLVGNFNSHLKDCLLLYADEAFWAGDKSSEGTLKALITEPEIVIEAKGRDAVTVPNRVRLLISSNCEWVIPAGLDERRFCVTEVNDSKIQDHHYFNAIIEQMKNGGRAAMLHSLLNHQSNVNLRSIPKTAALFDQKFHSFDAITKFWFECLWNKRLVESDEDWTGQVARSTFYESYFRKSEKAGIRNRSFETEFGKRLRKLCPSIIPTQNIYTDSGRERGWEFQPLQQCRLEFEQAVNMEINWHNSDYEELEDIFDAATKTLSN
ncbi:DUF5906 domain-containing protein, partial [bacterium]|nr:DUF5906 domain-containing protein [bacterium]